MAEPVRPEDIEAILAQFEASGCAELHIRFEGFELHLARDSAASAIVTQAAGPRVVPPSAPEPPRAAPPPPRTDDLEGLTVIRAPYLGTFYRAPKPGAPTYVEIGDRVEPESDLCLIEVMKLFTAVRAGVAGRVAKVLAADGAMVEAGQPLFAIAAG